MRVTGMRGGFSGGTAASLPVIWSYLWQAMKMLGAVQGFLWLGLLVLVGLGGHVLYRLWRDRMRSKSFGV